MDIAVLSDIHGNGIAPQACMEYLKKHPVDAYCFLGDYVGEFPGIRRVMDTLYELQENFPCYMLRGNKEGYMLSGMGKRIRNGTAIQARSECCAMAGHI